MHWVHVARESTENLGGPTGPVHRFDHRCDNASRHQERTIRAVQKTEEVARARFLIPEKHMPKEIHRQVSMSQEVKNLIDLPQGGLTPETYPGSVWYGESLWPTSG